jgi:hypothetical protein
MRILQVNLEEELIITIPINSGNTSAKSVSFSLTSSLSSKSSSEESCLSLFVSELKMSKASESPLLKVKLKPMTPKETH